MNDLEYGRELRSYLVGFAPALVPFALVFFGPWAWSTTLIVLGICAMMQIVVHFRFFLHIDLSRQKRGDLQLILFSVLLLIMIAIGTIWIMSNLATRM